MATDTSVSGESKQGPSSPQLLECSFYDVEEVNRLSQSLLVALAAACVEKTSGTFSQRAAVAPDVKKEMLDYLNLQSEAYANGSSSVKDFKLELVHHYTASAVLVTEFCEDHPVMDYVDPILRAVSYPTQIVKDMLDNFVKSKRNMFSRVSGIVVDAHKDDKINDFVRELDQTGVWLAGRREVLAKALFKRIDQRKTCHCEMKFDSEIELAKHQNSCDFRPVSCSNEGCDAVYSAIHAEDHDASCGYKLFPCYLECESSVQRKDMASHCATVCPMKKMKCPYHAVGCLRVMAQGLLESHCTEYMGEHLLETLQHVQNHEATLGEHAQRILLVEKAVQLAQRSAAVNVGNLNVTVKEQENKVNLLEAEVKKLRANQKTGDVSSELLQLKREFLNLQKRFEIFTSSSQSSR